MHGFQRRASDEAPFILHPLEVASLLHNTGHPDAVVAAGLLHDTVEDTNAVKQDIADRFGEEVADVVQALTENPRIDTFVDRKAALRAQVADFGDGAVAVYAADKVAKVRELRAHATRDATVLESSGEHMKHYAESLLMLEETRPDHPLVRQLRFELEVLRALPPRSGAT
jgi:(p)ppGpp synthase/HD superfamily hydrolase